MIPAPLAIIDVDLARELPRLDRPADARGACVNVWYGDRPLGRTLVLAGEFPLPPATVAALAARCAALPVGSAVAPSSFSLALPDTGAPAVDAAEPLPAAAFDRPRTKLLASPPLSNRQRDAAARCSVIVCTRGRVADLMLALAALAKLDPAPTEIIVVDNSRPPEQPVTLSSEFDARVRIVRQPSGGLSAARNAGIRAAAGEYIVFTDDDAQVHPAWLGRLLAGFGEDCVGCVTGMVLPLELRTHAQVAFEFGMGGLAGGYRPLAFGEAFVRTTVKTGIPVWRIGAGASMAFRREALAEAGPFDIRLGAGASGCSEDSEMWYRLLMLGWTCRFEPDAVVFHRHRPEWASLEGQITSYMAGHVASLLVQYARYRHFGNLRRILVNLPVHYVRQFVDAVLQGDTRKARLVWRSVLGCFKGLRPCYLAKMKPDLDIGGTA